MVRRQGRRVAAGDARVEIADQLRQPRIVPAAHNVPDHAHGPPNRRLPAFHQLVRRLFQRPGAGIRRAHYARPDEVRRQRPASTRNSEG